jgi:RHS repeat-associated protein
MSFWTNRVATRAGAMLLSVMLTSCGGTRENESLGTTNSPIGQGSELKIRQVYARGDAPTATLGTYNRDFVELYNIGDRPISLAGISFHVDPPYFYSFAGWLPNVWLAPGQSFLIAGPVVDGSPELPVAPDLVLTSPNASGTGDDFVQQSGSISIQRWFDPYFQANRTLDYVAFGTPGLEWQPTAALTDTTAILRKQGGTLDRNHNLIDFEVGAPTPRGMYIPQDPVPGVPVLGTVAAPQFGDLTKFASDAAGATGIEPDHAAWIVGYVKDGTGAPLSAASVSVVGQTQYGTATTRADGRFDLIVNGGATYTLRIAKSGYFEADRRVTANWLRTTAVDDILLVAPDANSTPLDGNSSAFQVAAGTKTTANSADTKDRTAVLMIPPNTKFKVGGTELPSLNLSLTEYTAGSDGIKRMPAPLTGSPAYTYAVEVSAGLAAGQSVDFTDAAGVAKDVYFYVDDFVGFPAGTDVPSGYYDRSSLTWVASKSGKVINVSVTNGVASVDTNGDGSFTTADQTAVGITAEELSALADRYGGSDTDTVITSLWRVPITHMTPYDLNWPAQPPDCESGICPGPTGGAPPPPPGGCGECCGASGNPGGPGGPGGAGDESTRSGSIIGCDSQVLGESAKVTGTAFTLNYNSSRTPGYAPKRQIKIDVTGAQVHSKETLITVDVAVAGQVHRREFVPAPNISWTFQWDGLDGVGRPLVGSAMATITIRTYFQAQYVPVAVFGQLPPPAQPGTGVPSSRAYYSYERVLQAPVAGRVPEGSWSLADWTLSPHHFLDVPTNTLYLGTGAKRSAGLQLSTITRIMGDGGSVGFAADGTSATAAGTGLDNELIGKGRVAVAPNGDVFVADTTRYRVRRIDGNGNISTVVGSGTHPCDGGPTFPDFRNSSTDATTSRIDDPYGLAIGADGSLYIASAIDVRKAVPLGNGKYSISHFAGGSAPCGGSPVATTTENILATAATFKSINGVAVAPDGSVIIGDRGANRVSRVDPAGLITHLAGNGSSSDSQADDGQLAKTVPVRVDAVAAGPDGLTYIAWGRSLVSVDRNGILHYLSQSFDPASVITDGALMSTQSVDGLHAIAATAKGSVIFYDTDSGRTSAARQTRATADGVPLEVRGWIREMDSLGVVTTLASSAPTPTGNGAAPSTPATALNNGPPQGWALAAAPNGDVIINSNNSLYRIQRPKLSDVSQCADTTVKYLVRSGGEGFCFTEGGIHKKTVNLDTGAALYTFTYNGNDKLSSIADLAGYDTTVSISDGNYEITPPGGTLQRTTLTLSNGQSNGQVTSIGDSIGAITLQPAANGLLAGLVDQEGNAFIFGYDSDGRLISDQSPLGTQTLNRTLIAGGQRVTFKNAVATRITTFDSTLDAAGVLTHKTTFPNLTTKIRTSAPSGREVLVAPDGTRKETAVMSGVPLSGQAPDIVEITTLPSGLARTIKRTTSDPPGGPRVDTTIYDDTVSPAVKATTVTTYNEIEQIIVATSPGGRTRTNWLDAAGRVYQTQVGSLTPFVYPHSDGFLQSISQGARITSFVYDPLSSSDGTGGYLRYSTDPLLSVTEHLRDIRGRYNQFTTASGTSNAATIYSSWYNNDLLKTVSTEAGGAREHSFTYNGVKEIQQYLAPPNVTASSPATNYTYTPDRDLLTEQPSGLSAMTRTYIASTGQLDTIALPATSLSTLAGTIDYDYFTTTNAATGAAAGRISKITGPASTNSVQYKYDGFLRTAQIWAGDVVGQATWVYNNRFWPSKETTVFGGSTFDRFLRYDNDGLVVCNSATASCSPASSDTLTVGYSAIHGNRTSLMAGGASDLWTYSDTAADQPSNAFGELRQQSTTVGGTVVADIVYDAPDTSTTDRRDALGRIRFKKETFRGATHPHDMVTNTWEYRYDERGQLQTALLNNDVAYAASYDSAGNRTTYQVGNTVHHPVFDAHDRIVSGIGTLTWTYYDNGETKGWNRPTSGTSTLHYDAMGQLRMFVRPSGTQISYIVDGQGRRIAKKMGPTFRRRWLYGRGRSPIAEIDDTGTLSRYVYGSNSHVPDLVIRGGNTYRLITDQLGSPVYAVNVNDKDDVPYQVTWGPFGEPIVGGGLSVSTLGWIPFGFAGGLYDPDTGYTHFGAREYDSVTGRWLSKDPIRFDGGQANLYAYVGGDPVNWIDPSGRFAVAAPVVLGGAAILLTGAAIYGVLASNPDAVNDTVNWIKDACGGRPMPTPAPDCRQEKQGCIDFCRPRLRENADLGGNWGYWQCIDECMEDAGC